MDVSQPNWTNPGALSHPVPAFGEWAGKKQEREGRPMTRLLAIAVAMLSVLTGCASPEEIRAADEAACISNGFQPNTPGFAGCLQRARLARQYPPQPIAGYGPGIAGYGPSRNGPGWYIPGGDRL